VTLVDATFEGIKVVMRDLNTLNLLALFTYEVMMMVV
jgi:hypothetical protein